MVQITSLIAYSEALENLGSKQLLILKAIDLIEPCNNLQISKHLRLPINSVTPRVYELREKGLIKLDGIRACPITGRASMFWRRFKR